MDLALLSYNGICAITPNQTKSNQTKPNLTFRTSSMRHKVNFKRCITGSNSELSISFNVCHTKVKKPSCPTIYPLLE